jgi:hypothetical protein
MMLADKAEAEAEDLNPLYGQPLLLIRDEHFVASDRVTGPTAQRRSLQVCRSARLQASRSEPSLPVPRNGGSPFSGGSGGRLNFLSASTYGQRKGEAETACLRVGEREWGPLLNLIFGAYISPFHSGKSKKVTVTNFKATSPALCEPFYDYACGPVLPSRASFRPVSGKKSGA